MFNDELDKRFRSFQFHKGTIKTFGTNSLRLWLSLFQFHKGTIKTFIVKKRQT